MKKLLSIAAMIIVTLSISSVGMATLIHSVDRATFQTAITGGTINGEDFDSLSAGAIIGVTPDLTYSASGGSPIVTSSYLTSTYPNGLGSTSAGFFLPTETATFTFSAPITAFAIDVNTYATTDSAYTATLDIGDIALSIFEVFPSTSTGQFLGFVSDTPFSVATIAAVTGFSYTLDTLVYGNAAAVTPGNSQVPEPTSFALLSLGILGLCGFQLLRRKKA